jgi:glycosyltransferase involved in cell wall biosynthesis/tetratricopeptide (TPR) repeat protein
MWEVGCGPGLLLDLASYSGWKTLGMEPAPEAAKWGHDVLGVRIIAKSLRRRPPLTDADVVIASEVVEHLESSLGFASALYDSLKKDGVALLTTPNVESKMLTERRGSWVLLGLGYHLVLYSAVAIERLLRNAGFQTVEVGTFEGPYQDERLMILASKRWVPSSLLREVLRNTFEMDCEALDLCSRYLWDVVRRFEGEKNIYWQGALYRLIEALNEGGQYEKALEVANRLEQFMQSQGWTEEYVHESLEEAVRNSDRRIFYTKVPTFIGNFHFLRGLALLHRHQEQKALEDFRCAFAIAEKLERLPYKAYEELREMPLSLHALFHIGFTLLQLGQHDEAISAFTRFLGFAASLPADSLTHGSLNLSIALEQQGRFEEATSSLDRLIALAKERKLPESLINQATRRTLEIRLHQRSRELGGAQQQLEERSRQLATAHQQMQWQSQQLEAAQQRLEWQSQELKETHHQLDEHSDRLKSMQEQTERQARELGEARERLTQVLKQVADLSLVLQQQEAVRRALEAQLQYLRYKVVDRLNLLLHRVPGFHKFAKAALTRALEWRRRHRRVTVYEPVRPLTAPAPVPRPKYQPVPPVPRQTAELAGCTIVAKHHIARARVLASSFRQHNSQCPFFVLVVDRVDGYFDPQSESFFVVEGASLAIPDQERFFFAYNVLEACTAVKPYFLEHLFRHHDIRKLVYLDPDILVFNSMDHLSALLDQHSIVLTPHLTAPIDDGFRPGEFQIMEAGTYNLGFIALRNCPEARRMLSWWQERLYKYCLMAHERGMHVDQKWIELVPGLFDDVHVTREPGYNVAYWNLQERRVEVRNDTVTVNGKPCYFFHFSGADFENLAIVSKHQNRFRLDELGDVGILFERYRKLMLAAAWDETKSWPYSYDYFDNGARIPDVVRRLYWEMSDGAAEFGDPFSTELPSSFFNWLNSGVDAERDPRRIVTHFWYEMYQQRVDVRAAYPDVLGVHREGFLEWIRNSGPREYMVDPRFFINMPRPSDASPESPGDQGKKESSSPPFGVNLLGYVRSEKGMGEAVRAELRNLEAAGIPYVVNDFRDCGSLNIERVHADISPQSPYSINLIHVNADQVPVLVGQRRIPFSGRYNIAYWNWELSEFPKEWCGSFRYFDEVWVPSSFVKDALSPVSPIPIVRMPLSINPDMPVEAGPPRSKFGLSADSFVFLFFFDFHSYFERKNPLGLVRAFKQAFREQEDVVLFLKTTHSAFAPAAVQLLREECQGADIRFHDAILPREGLNALLSACDCYVSLHRSEGFGLTLAEAMCFGKPVIATAYSGNVDFMREGNSFLVKYRLVEIEKDHGPYKKGCVWAEPDVGHAAELMRYVYEHRQEAAAMGEAGRRDVFQQLHPETVGGMVRKHLMRLP